jgi:hypothetical protein
MKGPTLPLLWPCIEASTQTLLWTVMKGPTLNLLSLDIGLYLAIIMDRHEGPLTPLTIAL